jgi:hypothetical protein
MAWIPPCKSLMNTAMKMPLENIFSDIIFVKNVTEGK